MRICPFRPSLFLVWKEAGSTLFGSCNQAWSHHMGCCSWERWRGKGLIRDVASCIVSFSQSVLCDTLSRAMQIIKSRYKFKIRSGAAASIVILHTTTRYICTLKCKYGKPQFALHIECLTLPCRSTRSSCLLSEQIRKLLHRESFFLSSF